MLLITKMIALMFCCAVTSSLANEPVKKGHEGQVLIVFNSVDVLRRTLDSAPIIGEGKEDYSVRIGCFGMDDCTAKIPSTYDLLSEKKLIKKKCKYPIYASITINFVPEVYDEKYRKDEKYEIDYSGKCVFFDGQYFKLKKSIFEIFYENPISRW